MRSETFVLDHAAALMRRGHDVVVVPLTPRAKQWEFPPEVADVVRSTAPEPSTVTAAGWRRVQVGVDAAVRSAAATRGRSWRLATDNSVVTPRGFGRRILLAERVRRFGPIDVLHAQFGTTASAALALRRNGITAAPIVCSVHGQDANVIARRQPELPGLWRSTDAVTVGTNYMRTVVESLGVKDNVVLWPQGIDLSRESLNASPGDQIPEDLRVISVGRLVEFKGVDDSLRVVAAARTKFPRLRYTVIGDGPLRASLEQLAVDLGVTDITTFVGAKDHREVLAAHRQSDVFLQMGKIGTDGSVEGQGVGPLEASASGLPCVVARAGGLPEMIVDGETGIIVPMGDIAAGAAALCALGSDSALGQRLGARGCRFVAERFSLAATTDTIEAIYAQVLEQSRVR